MRLIKQGCVNEANPHRTIFFYGDTDPCSSMF